MVHLYCYIKTYAMITIVYVYEITKLNIYKIIIIYDTIKHIL